MLYITTVVLAIGRPLSSWGLVRSYIRACPQEVRLTVLSVMGVLRGVVGSHRCRLGNKSAMYNKCEVKKERQTYCIAFLEHLSIRRVLGWTWLPWHRQEVSLNFCHTLNKGPCEQWDYVERHQYHARMERLTCNKGGKPKEVSHMGLRRTNQGGKDGDQMFGEIVGWEADGDNWSYRNLWLVDLW